MGGIAPKGNQYWKARTKHGRDRVIQSPVVLADAIDEYFQWCIDNPLIEIDFRGKDLERIELPHPRVFKKEELARFVGLSQWRLLTDLINVNRDFSQIIKEAEKVIEDQKYSYAVVGMFNANIIARDLGLKDNSEITTKTIPLSEEEIRKELALLDARIKE